MIVHLTAKAIKEGCFNWEVKIMPARDMGNSSCIL